MESNIKVQIKADVKPKFEADIKIKIEPVEEFMEIIKGGLISESFFTSAQILENVYEITILSIFSLCWIVFRGVIWHSFLQILAKLKIFLRWNHL